MKPFITILRGINVSGSRMIKMPALKTLYEELGFGLVETYVQSGNVVFMAREGIAPEQIAGMVEKKILEAFGYQVPVIIRSAREMEAIKETNPFVKEYGIDEEKLHVTFLPDYPASDLVAAIEKTDFPPDRFILSGREVYLYCPGGYGRTKLNNMFFERKLKTAATTRNWNTVRRLAQMAQEANRL